MSFSFYVPAGGVVLPPVALFDALHQEDLNCPDEPEDGVWGEGMCMHPHVRGVSARGVEICRENGAYQVRIMTCSSRGDYALARQLVRALVHLTRATHVQAEDSDAPMTLPALEARYGDAWVEQQYLSGPSSLYAIATQGNSGVLQLSGARRTFHYGARMAAYVQGEAMMTAFLALQNIDEEAYFDANPMQVTPRAGAQPFTLCAWVPDVSYVFPACEYLGLGGANDLVIVPRNLGPMLAGSHWRFLDEVNAQVEAIPAAWWPALLERARPHAVRF